MTAPAASKQSIPINILVNKTKAALEQIPDLNAFTEDAVSLCGLLGGIKDYLSEFNQRKGNDPAKIDGERLRSYASSLSALILHHVPIQELTFLQRLIGERFKGTELKPLELVKSEGLIKEFVARYSYAPGDDANDKVGKVLTDLTLLTTVFEMFHENKISISSALARV